MTVQTDLKRPWTPNFTQYFSAVQINRNFIQFNRKKNGKEKTFIFSKATIINLAIQIYNIIRIIIGSTTLTNIL